MTQATTQPVLVEGCAYLIWPASRDVWAAAALDARGFLRSIEFVALLAHLAIRGRESGDIACAVRVERLICTIASPNVELAAFGAAAFEGLAIVGRAKSEVPELKDSGDIVLREVAISLCRRCLVGRRGAPPYYRGVDGLIAREAVDGLPANHLAAITRAAVAHIQE